MSGASDRGHIRRPQWKHKERKGEHDQMNDCLPPYTEHTIVASATDSPQQRDLKKQHTRRQTDGEPPAAGDLLREHRLYEEEEQ